MAVDLVDHARRLLDGLPVPLRIGHLDLLVFFATHPRTLMASDDLARLMGISSHELASGLESLTTAGVVVRTPSGRGPTTFYAFGLGAQHEDVTAVMQLASTRQGRLALRRVLLEGTREVPHDRAQQVSTRGHPSELARWDEAQRRHRS